MRCRLAYGLLLLVGLFVALLLWFHPWPRPRVLTGLWVACWSMPSWCAGYAQVATFPPNVRYADRFRQLQQDACQAGVGCWKAP
jgi:hypothetical protein